MRCAQDIENIIARIGSELRFETQADITINPSVVAVNMVTGGGDKVIKTKLNTRVGGAVDLMNSDIVDITDH